MWEEFDTFSKKYCADQNCPLYIDKSLDIAINPTFECASNFNEGFAGVRINKKWGFIDKSGGIVITPNYTYANLFCEERSLVEYKNKCLNVTPSAKAIIAPIKIGVND